jgi:hypothetical protein
LSWRIFPAKQCYFHILASVIGNEPNKTFMKDILYIVAAILIIGWALGVFYFSVGGIIHLLLVIAVIAILVRIIRGNKV